MSADLYELIAICNLCATQSTLALRKCPTSTAVEERLWRELSQWIDDIFAGS